MYIVRYRTIYTDVLSIEFEIGIFVFFPSGIISLSEMLWTLVRNIMNIGYEINLRNPLKITNHTAQKMNFSIKDFFRKCDHVLNFLRIWLHLLKKSLMENFIFCAVSSHWEKIIKVLSKIRSIFSKLIQTNIVLKTKSAENMNKFNNDQSNSKKLLHFKSNIMLVEGLKKLIERIEPYGLISIVSQD